jgi:hypothetical protein
MDGENDFRKTTVSHFLAHAVTPVGGTPFVHFMWPGFITTSSGVNKNGVWVMMNDGQSRPLSQGAAARNATPDGWTQRQMLQHAGTVADAQPIAARLASAGGGACVSGCNLMVAEATCDATGAPAADQASAPAMVMESDRLATHWRRPGAAEPRTRGDEMLMVTNHFLELGYDARAPLDNFGREVYFSSLWRYEAAKQRVAALLGAASASFGVEAVRSLLQLVTHATTEHSIIAELARCAGDTDARVTLHVAIADMRVGGWDAPYLPYVKVPFGDFFAPPFF